jgi:hypothetical protein
LPDGLAQDTIAGMLADNALETYPRLREATGGAAGRSEEAVP